MHAENSINRRALYLVVAFSLTCKMKKKFSLKVKIDLV